MLQPECCISRLGQSNSRQLLLASLLRGEAWDSQYSYFKTTTYWVTFMRIDISSLELNFNSMTSSICLTCLPLMSKEKVNETPILDNYLNSNKNARSLILPKKNIWFEQIAILVYYYLIPVAYYYLISAVLAHDTSLANRVVRKQ